MYVKLDAWHCLILYIIINKCCFIKYSDSGNKQYK